MRPDATQKLKAAAGKRRLNPAVVGAVIAAVVLVAVVVVVLVASAGKSSLSALTPAGAVAGPAAGIVASGAPVKAGAPVVDLYEDFQCPICARFEEAFGAQLADLAAAGQVKLVVHTLSFLDTNLHNDSSTRAAVAAGCAADAGKFAAYHSAVFVGQPTTEGVGYTDAALAGFASTAGITGPALTTWRACVSSARYAGFVAAVQTAAEKAGVFGTPTLKVNGKDITKTLTTPQALVATIKAASK